MSVRRAQALALAVTLASPSRTTSTLYLLRTLASPSKTTPASRTILPSIVSLAHLSIDGGPLGISPGGAAG